MAEKVVDQENDQAIPGVINGAKKSEEEDNDKKKMSFAERMAFLRLLPGELDSRMPWVKEVTVLGLVALAATGLLLPMMMVAAMTLPLLIPLKIFLSRKSIKANFKEAVVAAKVAAKEQVAAKQQVITKQQARPQQDSSKQAQFADVKGQFKNNAGRPDAAAPRMPPPRPMMPSGQLGGPGHF